MSENSRKIEETMKTVTSDDNHNNNKENTNKKYNKENNNKENEITIKNNKNNNNSTNNNNNHQKKTFELTNASDIRVSSIVLLALARVAAHAVDADGVGTAGVALALVDVCE